MNSLFTFGCSYTDSYKNNEIENYIKYFKFRGDNYPLTWNEILSKKLNIELKNYGKGSCGNDFIFQSFCDHLEEIRSNDILIIEWTYNERFKWADNYNTWVHLSHGNRSEISFKTREDILINRGKLLYLNDIFNYEKVINEISKHVGFKVYYWCADFKIAYDLQNNPNGTSKYLCKNYINQGETIFSEILKRGGQRIKEETNNLINDLHMGETGHMIMAELFYEHIKNKVFN
jgi:hypothetical protein